MVNHPSAIPSQGNAGTGSSGNPNAYFKNNGAGLLTVLYIIVSFTYIICVAVARVLFPCAPFHPPSPLSMFTRMRPSLPVTTTQGLNEMALDQTWRAPSTLCPPFGKCWNQTHWLLLS